MANQLTVRELEKWCKSAIKQGYGDRKILLSSDDEMNNLHALWHGFSVMDESMSDMIDSSTTHNADELIILS